MLTGISPTPARQRLCPSMNHDKPLRPTGLCGAESPGQLDYGSDRTLTMPEMTRASKAWLMSFMPSSHTIASNKQRFFMVL